MTEDKVINLFGSEDEDTESINVDITKYFECYRIDNALCVTEFRILDLVKREHCIKTNL